MTPRRDIWSVPPLNRNASSSVRVLVDLRSWQSPLPSFVGISRTQDFTLLERSPDDLNSHRQASDQTYAERNDKETSDIEGKGNLLLHLWSTIFLTFPLWAVLQG